MSDTPRDEPQTHIRNPQVPGRSNAGPGKRDKMPAVPGRVVSGSVLLTGGRVVKATATSQATARQQTPRNPSTSAGPAALPDLPTKPLTPEQQAEAITRVQEQAEQRVRLGTQLFKAAEATIAEHVAAVSKARQEHHDLKETIQQDVAKSLLSYDQWLGQIDEAFTRSVKKIEDRVDALEQGCLAMEEAWHNTEQRLETVMNRAEAMVDASRDMLQQCNIKLAAKPKQQPEPLRREDAPAEPQPAASQPAPDPTLKLTETHATHQEPIGDTTGDATRTAPPAPAETRGVSAFETGPNESDPDAPEPIRYTQIMEQIKQARREADDGPRPAS